MRLELDHYQPQQTLDFGEYLDGLYGYAMVLSRNRTEAEDLVQETCLRALRAVGRLRTNGNVKSWLFTILRNIWLNQVRQRRTALTWLSSTQTKIVRTSQPMQRKIPLPVT